MQWHYSALTFFLFFFFLFLPSVGTAASPTMKQEEVNISLAVGKVYSQRFGSNSRYLSLAPLHCSAGAQKQPFRVQMWWKLKSRVKSGNSVYHKGGGHSIREKSWFLSPSLCLRRRRAGGTFLFRMRPAGLCIQHMQRYYRCFVGGTTLMSGGSNGIKQHIPTRIHIFISPWMTSSQKADNLDFRS